MFKISPEKAEWENDKLIVIPPRYSSASVIVDDHLYISVDEDVKPASKN
ncbi:MAG: hypothetical protein V8R52_12180 [Coprobacter fastidiosus]